MLFLLVHAEAIEESEPGLLVGESVEDARRRQIHMEVLMGSTSLCIYIYIWLIIMVNLWLIYG